MHMLISVHLTFQLLSSLCLNMALHGLSSIKLAQLRRRLHSAVHGYLQLE